MFVQDTAGFKTFQPNLCRKSSCKKTTMTLVISVILTTSRSNIMFQIKILLIKLVSPEGIHTPKLASGVMTCLVIQAK